MVLSYYQIIVLLYYAPAVAGCLIGHVVKGGNEICTCAWADAIDSGGALNESGKAPGSGKTPGG